MDRDTLIMLANTFSSFEEESTIIASIQFNGEIIKYSQERSLNIQPAGYSL